MVFNISGRSAGRRPRYYVYISRAKLDVLMPQLPTWHLPSVRVKIETKIMKSTLAAEWPVDAAEPGLVAKAGIVGNYLERRPEWVGTVKAPRSYIKGAGSLRYQIVRTGAVPLVVFSGNVDGVELALVGFEGFLVGAACEVAASHSIEKFIQGYVGGGRRPAREAGGAGDGVVDRQGAAGPVVPGSDSGPAPADAWRPDCFGLEFLAVPLYRCNGMLVATPLYVALAHQSDSEGWSGASNRAAEGGGPVMTDLVAG
ncbi:MAG: DUF7019 family protein [Actinocrinis sp.]